jgi:hypothetical protein
MLEKKQLIKLKWLKYLVKFFNKYKKADETISKAITKTRQDLQKIRGEKITKSGFLKGKDIKNNDKNKKMFKDAKGEK